MRILYGLCGEGKGHATRSLVVLEWLTHHGHDVLAVASGQAYPMIAKGHPQRRTLEIIGLSMHCTGGALDLAGSVELNARRLPELLNRNAAAWEQAERFAPHAVVTDFDSFAWLFAEARGLPVVSIDNAQVLPRCSHEPWLWSSRHGDGLRALESFVRSKAPSARHYIVTSFFYPPLAPECRDDTMLVPPILREDVLATLARSAGGVRPDAPILVYKTASLDDASFLGALGAVSARFVVYGASKEARMPANCTRREPSTEGFMTDLARSRAVIGNTGMSLLGEALAFGKPVYAVPVRGQYEQVLNACYLEQLGYGAAADVLRAPDLSRFLADTPRYAARIRGAPQHDGNARLYGVLEELFG